jgi:hypothetical protein
LDLNVKNLMDKLDKSGTKHKGDAFYENFSWEAANT